MKTFFLKFISRFVLYLKDPLHKNSLFLLATVSLLGIFGFFFWTVAARFYPVEDVGLASAIISAMLLVSMLSGLGFDAGIIRFLPEEQDKTNLLNSCQTITGIISLVLGAVFIAGLSLWSPALLLIQHDIILAAAFLLVTVATTLHTLQIRGIFVAFRATQFSLIQASLMGLKIALVIVLLGLGGTVIFYSWGIATLFSLIAGILLTSRLCSDYRPIPAIRKEIINNMIRFSLGSYIADTFREFPRWILPLLIVNVLGPESSAYFYVAWMIAYILFYASFATGFSLLAECSNHPHELQKQVIKATKFTILLLIPAIALLFLLGHFILSLFGTRYAEEALSLLQILAPSSIPVALNMLYATVKKVRKDMMPPIYMYAFITLATIGGSYFLMKALDLAGVGIAWLASNALVMLIVTPLMLKETNISLWQLLKGLKG